MSAADPSPLFTLVTVDPVSTVEGLDYSASSLSADTPYEVELTDGYGDPCAVPLQQEFVSLDTRLEFCDGSIGDPARLLKHEITLGIDFVTSAKRRQLERLMLDRRKVYFTPGYGRQTDLAYRPVSLTSSSFSDLTGRWTLSPSYDATNSEVWDNFLIRGYLREFANTRYVKTHAGTGWVGEPAATNRMNPATPTGNSDGDSGWAAAGAGSATLTKTYNANGFGGPGCAGAINVTGTSSSSARSVEHSFYGVAAIAGAGTLWACAFVKGRFGAGSSFQLTDPGAGTTTVSLANADYGEWTPVYACLSGTFTNTEANPTLAVINCIGASSQADTCDFWIGPTTATFYADATAVASGFPQWHPYTGSARTKDAITVSSYTIPQCGSEAISFYYPSWIDSTTGEAMCYFQQIGSGYGAITMYRATGGTSWALTWNWGGGSGACTVSVTPRTDQANSIICTWTDGTKKLYFNGAAVDTETGASAQKVEWSASATLNIFANNGGTYSTWPLIPLQYRIDAELWDANKAANIHAAMCHQAALEVIVPARGRAYRIRAIPSTPQSVSGDVHWIGALVLEQVSYSATLADQTSKEP